jgi:2-methylene-furan-3-one reductase
LYHEYGPAKEVLKFEEIPVPEVHPDQVLVKVKAAAINPVDFKRRTGYVSANSPFPIVPGYDCAGVVVRLGAEASKFKVGDEVYGMTSESPVVNPKQWGTLAPFTACEDKFLARKPQKLSFDEAASLPLAILTATEGLQKAGCGEGKTVLVLGGAGGVGTHVIQVAKHVLKAAHVAATGRASKTDFLKGLGADEVIDYHTVDYTEKPERYDIIFDTVGEGPTKGVKVLKEGGVLVSIATRDPKYRHVVQASAEVLEMLNPYLESGAIKAIIDPKGKFQFSETVQAFEYLETGRATGKVVIAPID